MAHPHRDYRRNRARRIAGGTWQPWADPAPVRDHVQNLLQAATFQAVGDAAAVGPMTVWEIAHGTRPVIRTGTAQALLAVQPADLCPPRVHANGPVWRLRSLIAMGHTTGRITTALGTSRNTIEALVRGDRATVTAALAGDITRLFDAWWDKRPPRQTRGQKAAACKALHRAAVHNWPCPAALDEDELDTPGYQPAAGWRYARGTGIADGDPLGKHRGRQPEPQPAASRTRTRTGLTRQGTTMTYPKDGNGRYLIPAEGPGAGAGYRKDATMHTTLTAKATPAEAAELQDRLERGCAKAWAAAREAGAADPGGSGHAARIQTALECHQVAADVVHETLASGMRRPAESTADFLTRTTAQAQAAEAAQAGPGTTGQLIRAPAGAGPARGTTARHQEEKAAAGLQTDAQATDRQTGTRQDAGPAGTGERDLTELDEAGLTPGAPHPDPALAAKGWRVCDHGIYTRRPDGHLQAEPQAC